MSKYTARISWRNDSPDGFTESRYTRGHEWSFDGGITLPASSSPHSVRIPYSVEKAVDPEEALVAAATAPDVNRQVINVGSGVETSLADLVTAVEDVTHLRLEPIFNPGASGGVLRMRADVTRANELLGFTPRTTLRDGLRLMLERDPRFALA